MSAGRVFSQIPPPVGRDLQLLPAQQTLPSPTGEQHSELDKELGWSDGHKQNIAPPNFHNSQVNTRECRLQGQDSHRAFSNCKTGYWRGIPLSGGATTQRTLDGKFLDSGNGNCSAVAAEYDEQKEREIAEAIFDWWISKKSFKQWFAETYQQGTLDLFDE